jgi:hypothetical protein
MRTVSFLRAGIQKMIFYPDSLIIIREHVGRFLSVKEKSGLNDEIKLIHREEKCKLQGTV